jgi:hypothetical protein
LASPSTLFRGILQRLLAPESGSLYRWLYLRGLGVIYLIAFASLIPQLQGLLGSDGILPARQFISAVANAFHQPQAFLATPSIFWLSASDNVLFAGAISGCIAALFAIAGFAAAPAFILLWVLYLSFVSVGQDFLAFQWDSLLLEAGFLAIFMAPWVVLDKRTDPIGPRSVIFLWMTRWLLFRLMLLSGLVKIASRDPAWLNASALNFHYETQPLPTPLAWYVHQLPPVADSVSTIIMFVIELVVPLFMFGGPRARLFAAVATIGLQVLILLTGNYTFFNLLTILLCVSLFDNNKLPRLIKGNKRSYPWIGAAVAIAIFAMSIEEIADEFTNGNAVSPTARQITGFLSPFRVVNTYGLFRIMTTTRDEITIEGSNDGQNWKPYVFRWKPGPLDRALPIVAPYQPRLDWQMWFASLGSVQRNQWFLFLCARLLQGSAPVLGLLETNPFPEAPPRFVRATIATYHLTTFDEQAKTHNWWRADQPTLYLPPISITKVE